MNKYTMKKLASFPNSLHMGSHLQLETCPSKDKSTHLDQKHL